MKGKPMTKNRKLQELFDHAAENAARLFNESDDHEVLPMWHAVQDDGEHMLIATPWRDDAEKEIAMEMLRDVFRQHRVKRFVFIVEAWIARVGTMAEVNEGPRPSEHPDRREVLMISGEDRDGSQIMGVYYILRPEHGPPKLSPLEVKPYDHTTGRMVGLLD
jgi:hypothetical protein